jgi:hypothetical protein
LSLVKAAIIFRKFYNNVSLLEHPCRSLIEISRGYAREELKVLKAIDRPRVLFKDRPESKEVEPNFAGLRPYWKDRQ